MSNLALNQNQTFQTPQLAAVTMDPQPNVIPAQMGVDPALTQSNSSGYNILSDVSQTSR